MSEYAMNLMFELLDRTAHTPEWKAMEATTEGTPWHREANVAVHTRMAMVYYTAQFSQDRTELENKHALMALFFHDFGKPPSQKLSPEGRNQYTGHEAVSSTMMFDFFAVNEDLWEYFVNTWGYTTADLEKIGWLVDNHLPYGLEKKSKRNRMKEEMLHYFGPAPTFYDMLRSDCAGRISDDHGTKLQNVEMWIMDFEAIELVSQEELQRIRDENKTAWFTKLGRPAPPPNQMRK